MDPRGHRGIRVLSAGHLELSRALLFRGHGDPDPTNRWLRLWHRGIPLHGHQRQGPRGSILQQALVGPQLNWSVREKECYGIFYGVRLFEDLLDNRPFILKADHMNLTYLNVTLTGKVLRWKLYLQSI